VAGIDLVACIDFVVVLGRHDDHAVNAVHGYEMVAAPAQIRGVFQHSLDRGFDRVRLGMTDVVALEQGQLTSGTTWRAAGLGFAVKSLKKQGLIGQDALALVKSVGIPHRRMLQFLLLEPEPLLYGNELIALNGDAVGHIQFGGYGHTVGGAVGLGFVDIGAPVTAEIVAPGVWEINIAGQSTKAGASMRPLHDPMMAKIKC